MLEGGRRSGEGYNDRGRGIAYLLFLQQRVPELSGGPGLTPDKPAAGEAATPASAQREATHTPPAISTQELRAKLRGILAWLADPLAEALLLASLALKLNRPGRRSIGGPALDNPVFRAKGLRRK